MTRARRVPIRANLGRKLLLEVLRTRTETAVARVLGVSHSTVSRIAAGHVPTDYYLRRALEKHFGIQLEAFDVSAESFVRRCTAEESRVSS